MNRTRLAAGLAAVLALAGLEATQVQQAQSSDVHSARPPRPPRGFTEHDARVNGIRMHYVVGGHGPTLVLLHGYPQNSHEWYGVLPELGQHYTVVAPDLRGAGRSSAPASGYDKRTMAADVHALLQRLGRTSHVRVVGHDIGTMVAFAYADAYRSSVERLVLTEAPQPDASVYQYPSLTPAGPGFWNFGFFNLRNGLPEQTIDGHETQWIRGFLDWLAVDKQAFTRRDLAAYADPLRDDAHLRASFEWFRAFGQDRPGVEAVAGDKLTVPVLAVGADHSLGCGVADQIRSYATDVRGGVITGSGHWIWEEQPEQAVSLLLEFLDGSDATAPDPCA